MIGRLTEQVNKQKLLNNSLNTKVAQLTEQLERKKKEILVLKRTAGSTFKKSKTSGIPEVDIVPGPNHLPGQKAVTKPDDPHADSGLLDIARNYKARFVLSSINIVIIMTAVVVVVLVTILHLWLLVLSTQTDTSRRTVGTAA